MGVFTSTPILRKFYFLLIGFYIYCALNRNSCACLSEVTSDEPHAESGKHQNNVSVATAAVCHEGVYPSKFVPSPPLENNKSYAIASEEFADVEKTTNYTLGDENSDSTKQQIRSDVAGLQGYRELTYEEAEALNAPNTRCRMVYVAGHAHCWINLNRDDASFLDRNLPLALKWIESQLEKLVNKYDMSSELDTVTNVAIRTRDYALSAIWEFTKRGVSIIKDFIYDCIPVPEISLDELENTEPTVPNNNPGDAKRRGKRDKPKLKWYQFEFLENIKLVLSPPTAETHISLTRAAFVEKLKLLNVFYGKPRQNDSIDKSVRYYLFPLEFSLLLP